MKKFIVVLLTVGALSAFPETRICWDASNNFGDWGAPVRMSLKRADGNLLMISQAGDPSFGIRNQKLNPASCSVFEVVYRTRGKIEKGNFGVLYFQTARDRSFSEERRISLGKLNDNGEWQRKSVRITQRNTKGLEQWQNAEFIKALRLDLIGNAGSVEIRSIAFRNLPPPPEAWLEEISDGIFSGVLGKYKVSREQPVCGEFCMEQGESGMEESIASLARIIPVKPDTKYRIRVYARNTIPLGSVVFGFAQSRSAEIRKVTRHTDWGWSQLPCNMTEWTPCELDLTTSNDTRGLMVYFKVKNEGVGRAWWDKLEVAGIVEKDPALAILSFPLMSSFTDIPVEIAEPVYANGKLTRESRWRKLSADSAPLTVSCNRLLPDSCEIELKVERAGKLCFTEKQPRKERLTFHLPLTKLPEGRYRLTVSAIKDGTILCRAKKDFQRMKSLHQKMPEPVKSVSTLPGRILAVNGTPVTLISYSHMPTMHCRPDLTQFPDIENYMETARRQLGVNILNIISYGKAPSEKNLPRAEYLKQAVRFYADSYLRQLDFCLKNRFYGTPSLHMGSSLRPRGKIDFDLIRGVVKQIRNHPALLCYKYDEPEVRKVVTPEDIRTMYRIIKEEDPVHPVSINLCDRGRFHEFLPGSDIASYDHYPFPHSDLNAWRLYTTDILRLKPDAPFFTMLQTFQFPNTELPSQEEIYASFITSMIDGARSLTCYSWFEFNNCTSLVKSPDMQAAARLMAAHYEQLCRYLFRRGNSP